MGNCSLINHPKAKPSSRFLSTQTSQDRHSSSRTTSRSKSKGMANGRRTLHAVLGGGKVADIMLWRDGKKSVMVLVGVVVIWFLFEVLDFTFVTLLSYICIIKMLVLLIWSWSAKVLKWSPPSAHYVRVPESSFRWLLTNLNMLLSRFHHVAIGSNWIHFFVVAVSMWILATIGNYISFLNLICFVIMCSLIGPVLYEFASSWGIGFDLEIRAGN